MKKWESYEEVATHLLDKFANEFGLDRVEGKQKIKGQRSGTEWEIDAKGAREGNEGFVIVECRRWTTSKQSQEKIGSLAYRIIDSGAEGGILVSTLGVQEGAKKIADAENIIEVQLTSDSTPYEYLMRFLTKVMLGVQETVNVKDSVVVIKLNSNGN
jgi:hypothetical protein